MILIYFFMVITVCVNLGNSLVSTKNQIPSEERYNFFDSEFLQIFNQRDSKNVLISPMSIKLVLGMLMEGAQGETASEIRNALRLPVDEDTRRSEFHTRLSDLQKRESSNVLKVANRMFLSSRYFINSDYENTLRKYYLGGVTRVKFEDAQEACRVINTWVSNQTSELITCIVEPDQISADNKLMLASAVYFKGLWATPFSSERSAIRCFYSKDNKCTDTLMMMETGYFDYGYISRLDAKAIVLPYKGGKFSMLLLLPAKSEGVELLGRDLMHVSLSSIFSEIKEQEVFVQIPKFEVTSNEDLVESLKSVHIFEIFSKKANFSKMFSNHSETVSVSHVYHSAKIIVNEEGSVAAATTGALFVPLMGGTTISFVANHPFIFFVLDSDKNSVLFAGKIVLPLKPEEPHKETFKKTTPLSSEEDKPAQATAQTTRKANESFQNHRQRTGPKFRSITPELSLHRKPLFNSNEGKITTSSAQLSKRRNLVSHPAIFFDNKTQNHKKVEKAPELPKSTKRQESSDDWRRHILFFT